MKKKRSSKVMIFLIIPLILALIYSSFTSIQVKAAPRTGDIEIDFEGRTDDREDVILAGAKFEIFPIQYMDQGILVWRDEFAACGISLEDTSAGAREEQAKELFAYAQKNKITGIIHVTDSNGHASFPDLAEGIYLLAEIGDVENGSDGFHSAPFLVNIPSEVNGKFEYEVDVEPKADWASHEGKPVGPYENPTVTPTGEPNPTVEPTDGPNQDYPKDNNGKETGNNQVEKVEGGYAGEKVSSSTSPKKDPQNVVQRIVNGVKTGDATNTMVWSCGIAISMGTICWIVRKKKEK